MTEAEAERAAVVVDVTLADTKFHVRYTGKGQTWADVRLLLNRLIDLAEAGRASLTEDQGGEDHDR